MHNNENHRKNLLTIDELYVPQLKDIYFQATNSLHQGMFFTRFQNLGSRYLMYFNCGERNKMFIFKRPGSECHQMLLTAAS